MITLGPCRAAGNRAMDLLGFPTLHAAFLPFNFSIPLHQKTPTYKISNTQDMNTANNFSAADTAVRRIPLEDFFRNSQEAAFQLSPDGRHLSFMAPYEERMNVFVRPVEGGEAVRVTSETLRSVAGYICLLYTSPSPRDSLTSRMPSSA